MARREVPVGPSTYRIVQQLVTDAPSNAEIARRQFLTINTVKTLLRRLYAKAEVTGRSDLILQIARGELLITVNRRYPQAHRLAGGAVDVLSSAPEVRSRIV